MRSLTLPLLAAAELNVTELRALLNRLDRPDLPGLPALVTRELADRKSRGFGSLRMHRRLLRSQLDTGWGSDEAGNRYQLPKLELDGSWPSSALFAALPRVLSTIGEALPDARADRLIVSLDVLDGEAPLCALPPVYRFTLTGPCADISANTST